MKNVLKFVLIIGVFVSIYYIGEQTINWIMPENQSFADTSLLFTYGGMTGYVLFIIFISLLQFSDYNALKIHKPKLGRLMSVAYIFVVSFFLIYPFISFNLQFSILMALVFMLITSMLEMVRDRMIQGADCKSLHPKKLL